ncbi:MAG TPA: hypothetical protein VG650_03815 [Mycobacteriales bacterium]|nr:hypothetical protein [Mycobacteriales bacterium]
MSADATAARIPTGVHQLIEISERLEKRYVGLLTRTAIYRCVCSSEQGLIAAGVTLTSELVELVAQTAIERRIGRSGFVAAEGQPSMLLAEAS